jgi:very-short-patch-repair endonuclease
VMLRWHYRSRDPSLIAFSNVEFYKRQLLLFPKPGIKEPSSGVSLVRVQGTYGNRINLIEARKCAAEAVAFMRRHPERSLGIVALNRPQADLIEHELDQLIARDREAQRYKTKWENSGLEPIFVKNLESVQGDERDTIFISTVFGPDEDGNFMQRFGPINSSVGHRRLNVLFSRAKHQVVVFSSIEPSRILVGPDSHLGVGAFRRYLEFATTGEIASHQITGRSTDSFFEQSVKEALEDAGYTCEPQVGVAGFFIDLGVRTHNSIRFLLGVECDGASYHSSPFARDRDRLRQAILENLGWKIHRVWSTDWFRDPKRELNKLVIRLESLAQEAEAHTPPADVVEPPVPQEASADEDADLAKVVAHEIAAEADMRIQELLRVGLVEFDETYRIAVPSYSGDLFSQIRVTEFYNQQCYQWLKKHSLLPWEEMPWPEIRDIGMRLKVRAQAIRDVVARIIK